MGFAENLRDELEYQGMQVKELAEKTGISINTLNKYRPGSTVVPTVDNALKIAKVLGVSLDYLATGSDMDARKSPEQEVVSSFAKALRRFSQKDRALVYAVIESLSEKYR